VSPALATARFLRVRYDEVTVSNVSFPIAPQPYDAVIEDGLLSRAGAILKEVLPERTRYFVISVPPVRKAWGPALMSALAGVGLEAEMIEMPDGEGHKTLNTVEHLSRKLVKAGADRQSVLVAFGGGVVGDVGGFVAACYMRGIDYVQVPTTLLAQVDAALGGKTGVNLREGKNLVGRFHQPRCVLIDPSVLSTLPEREFRSGLYEALKCGIVGSAEVFERLENQRDPILRRDPAALEWMITECVKLKAAIVTADTEESGPRRMLNFGHTIGHALEAETSYRQFLHGEAVAWGMVAAAMIAAALQKTDSDTARRIISTVLALAPLPKVDLRGKRVFRRLKADKKRVNGSVPFVLPCQIGQAEIVLEVPDGAVIQAIEELRYLSQA
jgi:3-dehydroquinate synthase